MEKEKQFLMKKRNLKNNSSNNYIKKDLLTYNDLKRKAKKNMRKAKSINELKNCMKIYDVNEDINLQILNSIHNIEINEAYNEFPKYQNSIPFKERIQFIQKYENQLLKVEKNMVKILNIVRKKN